MRTTRLRISLLAVCLFTLLSFTVKAQNDDKQWFGYMDIYAGPRIGVVGSNMTKLNGDFLFGPSIGGFFEVHFTDKLAASFDLNYTYEGTNNAKCSSFSNGPEGTTDISMHMLNSDYRCRYYLMRNFNVAAGVHLMRVLKAYGKIDGKSEKLHKYIRRGNISIPFSAEYNLGPWAIEASYYLPLRKWDRKNENILDEACTNKFSVTLAYKLQVF